MLTVQTVHLHTEVNVGPNRATSEKTQVFLIKTEYVSEFNLQTELYPLHA